MRLPLAIAAAAALACALPGAAIAQATPASIVSIYRIASGQQVNFLKWLARQDEIAAAAGVARSQLYIHTDGDSWDYVVIAPQTNAAQDAAIDAASRKRGIIPRRVGLELRKYIASHTDTMTNGPTSAASYLAWIGEK
jgi:membrane-bound lytic murein transglycosylase B